MATKFIFNNKQVSIPGSYSKIESGIKNPPLDLEFGNALSIDTGSGAGFGGGYFYKEFKKVSVQNKMKIVSKDEVFIAVDEYQRFMIVERETGNYTVFEDSIGQKIFSMYARNIWGQHNTPTQQ